jgi:iron complex outermembrane receptor protein
MPKELKTWNNMPTLFKWVLVLALLVPVFSFAQTTEEDAEEEEEVEELEAFVMTGSRIPQLSIIPVNPVTRITSESLQETGFSTVGDALRALPIISGQSLVSEDAGTSFTPGVSSVNLRGLGNNNTLALINGRRAVPFPSPGFNGFQTVVDVSSIPAEAVESIEILRDGASAIYGSDAVAGVINFNLAKSYEGVMTEFSLGNTFDNDSLDRSAFVIGGATSGKLSMVFTLSYRQRNPMFSREIPWLDTANPGSSANISANVFLVNEYTQSDGTVIGGGWTSWKGAAPNQTVADLPAGPLTIDDFRAGRQIYNWSEHTGYIPQSRSVNFYTRMNYDFTESITGFVEASFARNETVINAAPTPAFFWTEDLGDAGGAIVFPESNPFNPFSEDITFAAWRMLASGVRENDVQADSPRIVTGLEGEIGDSGWTWETGVLWSESEVVNINSGTVFDTLLQDALNGVTIDGELLYANPFGQNDQRVLDYMTGNNPTSDSYEILSIDASVGGTIVENDNFSVLFAAGTEYRSESLESVRTTSNETGNIVGGSNSSSVFGERDVYALFAEVKVPFGEKFELQFAGRYENYSDFGNTTKPKVALRYQPTDWLLVRGSFGQSFRAPDLPFLFSSGSVSFTSGAVDDPLRTADDDNPQQIKTLGGGNPELTPEETDVIYAGIAVDLGELVEALDGLTFEVDYSKFEQDNVISRLGANQIVANSGDPFWDQFINRAPPTPQDQALGEPGPILNVSTQWQNLDQQVAEFWDIGIQYLWETENMGEFRFRLEGTYLEDFTFTDSFGNTPQFAGTYAQPRIRSTGRVSWTKGDWAASVFVDYIGKFEQLTDGPGGDDVDSYYRVNPQVAWQGPWSTTLTVGVRNVFNEEPPIDNNDSLFRATGVHNAEPRFWYLRLSKDW